MKFLIYFVCCFLGFAIQAKELSVISYNTYLLPRFPENTSQYERAQLIGQWLVRSDFDVIALQEVFTKKHYKIIQRYLRRKYYSSGRPDRQWFKIMSSGTVIFSRYPIVRKKIYRFSGSRHADIWNTKGILMVTLDLGNGKRVNVMNTHFQSQPDEKYARIRRGQVRYMKKIMSWNDCDEMTCILTGDYNIPKRSDEYPYFREQLNFTPMNISGPLQFTRDSEVNTIVSSNKVSQQVLDYIFVYPREGERVLEQRILDPRGRFWSYYGSLSDHQPVSTLIEL